MGDTAEDQDGRPTVEAAGVTSFSELLMLSDGILSSSDHSAKDDADGGKDEFGFVFSGTNGARMLCFSGGYQNDVESLFLEPSSLSGVSLPDPSCIISSSDCKNSNDTCTVDKAAAKPSKVSL